MSEIGTGVRWIIGILLCYAGVIPWLIWWAVCANAPYGNNKPGAGPIMVLFVAVGATGALFLLYAALYSAGVTP